MQVTHMKHILIKHATFRHQSQYINRTMYVVQSKLAISYKTEEMLYRVLVSCLCEELDMS